MPIALPAPATPELGTVEAVRAQGTAYVSAAFQQTQIHVHGPDVVPKERLEQAITGAGNLSDAVRRIQAAYYLAGYPAARAVYALAEPDLYVAVTLGKVSRVEAPEPYAAYFNGLKSSDPLTDEALEPGRTLASVHADRAGQAANPTFVAEGADTVLRVEPNDSGPKRSSIGAGFGNPGNRFVGRHFADWFAKHSFTTGDEMRFTGHHAMEGLDDDEGAAGYHEHTAGWSRVTPWGIFALNGRYVGYQQRLEVPTVGLTQFDGDIREAELGWTGLMHSSFSSRWTVGAKVDWTRKDFATTVDDIVVQRQEYGSVEGSTEYAHTLRPFDLPTELSAGVVVRSGLGSDETDNPTKAADLGYLLFRPTLSAKVKLGDTFSLRGAVTGQFSGDTLPEQQQWVMGGVGNVEAYLPGVGSGDIGGLARIQLETTPYEFLQVKVVPRLFVEYGMAEVENPLAGQPDDTQSIADGGVSLSFLYGPLEASVSYAESFEEDGIDEAVLEDADANAFFRVAVKF